MSFDNSTTVRAEDVQGTFSSNVVIEGSTIRTAAPPNKRWELDSTNANELQGFSGDPNESSPGALLIDSVPDFAWTELDSPSIGGASPVAGAFLFLSADATVSVPAAYAYLHSDYLYLEGRKNSTFGVLVDMSAAGVTFDTTALGAARPINFKAGAGGVTTDGDLTVGGKLNAPGTVYSVAYSGTTDASGFLTVAHTAGFVPASGWAMTTNPNSSFAQPYGIDTLTSTSARLRFANIAGTGAAATTAVAGRLFLLHP